jgi:apolipoprotein N-acyltransferase
MSAGPPIPARILRLVPSTLRAMSILAAVAAAPAPHSTVERLQSIPLEFWWKMGVGVVGLVVLVIALRKLAHVNKLVLGIIVALVLSIIGFNWIYERNEPSWATPVVERLAGFFPTKDKIEHK